MIVISTNKGYFTDRKYVVTYNLYLPTIISFMRGRNIKSTEYQLLYL